MRLATTALLLLCSPLLLRADDLVTRDQKVYHDYKVVGHDDGYITIIYSEGGGRIPLKDLPDDMQRQYGYDPVKAAAYVKQFTDADAQQRLAVIQAQSAPPPAAPAPAIPTAAANPVSYSADDANAFERGAGSPPDASPAGMDIGSDPLAPGATLIRAQGDDSSDDSNHASYDSGGDPGGIWVDYTDLKGQRHSELRRRDDIHLRAGDWFMFVDAHGYRHFELKEWRAPERIYLFPPTHPPLHYDGHSHQTVIVNGNYHPVVTSGPNHGTVPHSSPPPVVRSTPAHSYPTGGYPVR